MERVVTVFRSHQEAEAAERAWYRQLTPAERIKILLEIIERHVGAEDASAQRLERVARVIELSRS
jgi:hypothetical protein